MFAEISDLRAYYIQSLLQEHFLFIKLLIAIEYSISVVYVVLYEPTYLERVDMERNN